MDPELTTCPKCKRRGCWTLETTVDEDPYSWELLIYKDWVCKCGHYVPVEDEAMTDHDAAKRVAHALNRAAIINGSDINASARIIEAEYAALAAEAQRLREALNALYVQALQSNVNEPSNEYGREALGMARAALNQERT